jgi:hypothetical protein
MRAKKQRKTQKEINAELPSTRIREDEMVASIYRPKDNIQEVDKHTKHVLVFTIVGKHDGFVDELGNVKSDGYPVVADKDDTHAEDLEHAYAQRIQRGRQVTYWIKKGGDGRLYNPIGIYNEHLGLKSTSGKYQKGGIEVWKYGEVNREIFLHYLNFLRTRNQAWLINAQRELV